MRYTITSVKLSMIILFFVFVGNIYSQGIAYYTGVVINSDNRPIEMVNVVAGTYGATSDHTDKDGKFNLKFTEAPSDTSVFYDSLNTIIISFNHPHYKPFRRYINVAEGDSIHETVALELSDNKYSVQGRILFEDSPSAENGYVIFHRVDTDGSYINGYVAELENEQFYTILPEGFYYAEATVLFQTGTTQTFRRKYYPDAVSIENASLLDVSQSLQGLEFIFEKLSSGTFSGKVINMETKEPIEEAWIGAIGDKENHLELVNTDENGNYSIELFEGEYKLFAYKEGFLQIYYDQVQSFFDATPLVINDTDTLYNDLNFELPLAKDDGNMISGLVTEKNSSSPIAGVDIYLLPTDDRETISSNIKIPEKDKKLLYKTDNNGAYTLDKVANGSYYVLFSHPLYNIEFFNEGVEWENAEIIRVEGGTILNDISIELERKATFGGEISGFLSEESSGEPLNAALISAYNKNNELISTAVSSYDGSFKLTGLQSSDYTLKASKIGYSTSEYIEKPQINLINSPVVKNIEFKINELTGLNENVLPQDYYLHQNYPNPFNPSTTIEFILGSRVFTKLIVYDILGRKVAVLVNGMIDAGTHSVKWNAEKFSSGVYYYSITAGSFRQSKKLIIMK